MSSSRYKKAVKQMREGQAREALDLSETIDKWKDLCYQQSGTMKALERERQLWESTARELARQLGKTEYADAEYQNQKAEK